MEKGHQKLKLIFLRFFKALLIPIVGKLQLRCSVRHEPILIYKPKCKFEKKKASSAFIKERRKGKNIKKLEKQGMDIQCMQGNLTKYSFQVK